MGRSFGRVQALAVLAILLGVLCGGAASAQAAAPAVQLVSPTPADPLRTQPIAIAVFTEPMDRPSTEAAFTLTRLSQFASPVPGSVVWFGDRVAIFVPARPEIYASRYEATVAATAEDQAGQPLAAARTWSFSTRAVTIDATGPADRRVPVDTPFYTLFSDPMNQASVASQVRLQGPDGSVPARIGWLSPTAMVFVPDAPLEPGRTYLWYGGWYAEALDGTPILGYWKGIPFTTAGP